MKLVVDNLYKSYKKHKITRRKNIKYILNGLSFTIEDGEVYALVGQNGIGKTTTIKCILKFIKYNKGSIAITDGESIENLMKDSRIGYMPEHLSLANIVTLREFLYDLSILRGMDKKDSMISIEKLCKQMGMDGFLDSNISKFSKGMKKKVGFMQAVLNNPKILILDEPTDGLDPVARKNVLDYIRKVANEGSIVIITSHILSDLEVICDKWGFVKNGKIMSEISPKDILKQSECTVKCEITNEQNQKTIIELNKNHEFYVEANTYLKISDIQLKHITIEDWYYNMLLEEGQDKCGK